MVFFTLLFSGPSAIDATLTGELRRIGLLIFMNRLVIVDLASENVTNQLAELDGVTGPFKALHCHAGSMA